MLHIKRKEIYCVIFVRLLSKVNLVKDQILLEKLHSLEQAYEVLNIVRGLVRVLVIFPEIWKLFFSIFYFILKQDKA